MRTAPTHYTVTPWLAHAAGCPNCQRVDFSKPATLAHTCLEGARSVKQFLAAQSKKPQEQEPAAPTMKRGKGKAR